jgi:FMN phosphatase YigB (HAD superfamily)
MKYDAILFDLDGTLLNLDSKVFAKGYLKALTKKLSVHEPDAKKLMQAILTGTQAMLENKGTRSNEDAFWSVFCALTGLDKEKVNPDCMDFYANEFRDLKQLTQRKPKAQQAVQEAKKHCDKLVLAVNPLFPLCAQIERVRWAGIDPDEFDYITSYENSSFCKPSSDYFLSIKNTLNLLDGKCLVIGNDYENDILSSKKAGMSGFYVAEDQYNLRDSDKSILYGSFEEMIEFLKTL